MPHVALDWIVFPLVSETPSLTCRFTLRKRAVALYGSFRGCESLRKGHLMYRKMNESILLSLRGTKRFLQFHLNLRLLWNQATCWANGSCRFSRLRLVCAASVWSAASARAYLWSISRADTSCRGVIRREELSRSSLSARVPPVFLQTDNAARTQLKARQTAPGLSALFSLKLPGCNGFEKRVPCKTGFIDA